MHREPREYDLHALVSPSLVFVYLHLTIQPTSSIPSSVVEIGGLYLKAAKKLPKVSAIK